MCNEHVIGIAQYKRWYYYYYTHTPTDRQTDTQSSSHSPLLNSFGGEKKCVILKEFCCYILMYTNTITHVLFLLFTLLNEEED